MRGRFVHDVHRDSWRKFNVDCSYPENFTKYSATPNDPVEGVLHVIYTWGVHHGPRNNLRVCGITEKVDYDGGNPFEWPGPYPDYYVANPWIWPDPPGTGDNAGAEDYHEGGEGSFRTPYSETDFNASQVYRYSCPCKDNGALTVMWGPKTIARTVRHLSGGWTYKVEKDGDSSSKVFSSPPLPVPIAFMSLGALQHALARYSAARATSARSER